MTVTTRVRRRPGLRLVAALLSVGLLASACGDDGEGTATAATEPGDDSTSTSTTGAGDDNTSTSTTSTTTTVPEPAGPEPLPLDDIPDLVAAWGDGTGDPLQLAQDIIGFPLEIPVPDGTTPHGISVDLFGGDTDATWEWDWAYEALSTEPIPDIDIRAPKEDPSPGYVALSDFYDPIMAELGYRRSGTTGSDPGDEGGPHSVNHVYTSDAETVIVNGLEAIPEPAFAWADEELVFGEGVPGYRVDVPFEIAADEVPVPLLLTIIGELPEIDGAELVDARILSWTRPADSFDADYGLRYFDVELEWTLPAGSAGAAQQAIVDGLDGTAFAAGSESFFDPGFLDPEEPRIVGDDWIQNVVFVNRYEGSIEVGESDDGPTLSVEIRFEPGRVELQPPAE